MGEFESIEIAGADVSVVVEGPSFPVGDDENVWSSGVHRKVDTAVTARKASGPRFALEMSRIFQ